MGKFQNSTSPQLLFFPTAVILSQPAFLWKFPVTGLTKVTYWDFDISIFFKILDSKGGKIWKCYSSYSYTSYDAFSTKLFLNVPGDNSYKVLISNLKIQI